MKIYVIFGVELGLAFDKIEGVTEFLEEMPENTEYKIHSIDIPSTKE